MLDSDREFLAKIAEKVNSMGAALEHHDFVLQALTSSMQEIARHMPREDAMPDREYTGDERRTGEKIATAYKLPEGYGSLLVSLDLTTGMARIENRNHDYRNTTELALQFRKH